MSEDLELPNFGFDKSRNLPNLTEGGYSVDQVAQSVNAMTFRDEVGALRGFRFGYRDADGEIIVENGDTFVINDAGTEIDVKKSIGKEHQATKIQEEDIPLKDGSITVTKKPVSKLFDGEIIPGMLVFNPKIIDASGSTIASSMRVITISRSSTTVNGQITEQKKVYQLHNPFDEIDDPLETELSEQELLESGLRYVTDVVRSSGLLPK